MAVVGGCSTGKDDLVCPAAYQSFDAARTELVDNEVLAFTITQTGTGASTGSMEGWISPGLDSFSITGETPQGWVGFVGARRFSLDAEGGWQANGTGDLEALLAERLGSPLSQLDPRDALAAINAVESTDLADGCAAEIDDTTTEYSVRHQELAGGRVVALRDGPPGNLGIEVWFDEGVAASVSFAPAPGLAAYAGEPPGA